MNTASNKAKTIFNKNFLVFIVKAPTLKQRSVMQLDFLKTNCNGIKSY